MSDLTVTNTIVLHAVQQEGRTLLSCPEVGLFTGARKAGQLLSPGEGAGFLVRLGVSYRLTVPQGIRGRIASERPDRVHRPVGFGDVLYELEPIGDTHHEELPDDAEAGNSVDVGLVLPAPHAGRFWHRPTPDDPPLCQVGDELTEGAAVGLIEIMKSFTQIPYTASGGLPSRARVLRMIAGDGCDVELGQPLIAVESAS